MRVGLVITLLGGLGLMVAQPWLWGQVFEAAAALRDRQTQQLQLANVAQLTEEIRKPEPAAARLLDQTTVAFPPLGAAPQIVERLEALAAAQALTMRLDSIREVAPLVRTQKLIPFDITLTVVGSPRASLVFLDAVEHMQELTQVEKWNLVATNAPVAGEKVYRLEMTVRFFLQPAA